MTTIPSQYTPIARHIRAAGLERTVHIAEALAQVIVDLWRALEAPPAPAAILIDRRRETRIVERFVRFAPR